MRARGGGPRREPRAGGLACKAQMDPTPYPPDDPRGAARARFIALIGGADADPPLAETALVIALEEYPALQVRVYLARLLTDLKLVYLRQDDPERAWRAAERRRRLAPDEPSELLECGILCGRLGRYTQDAAALTRYLETVPEGRERTQAETELARQRHWLSRLN